MIDGMISFIFYRSILPFFGFFLFFPKYQKYRKKSRREKRKRELAAQFRESIQAVSTSLNAGYSVENAFVEAYGDMKQTYGEDAPIAIEYRRIAERLKNNEAIEVILKDFALRCGVEDIRDFSDVFSAAKRSGGDMGKIIRRASGNISEKMEVKREIDTLISSKRYEQRIMEIVPFAIIAYLSVISPGFMDGLYHNPIGIAVMSACLGIYAGGFFLAEKIMRIEV
ncbi:MAG: type II secretion system F family protein [Lachnospiraceae bacterium]|nr:type II secretion system F family protein [Lachnospiraceae bacterium]